LNGNVAYGIGGAIDARKGSDVELRGAIADGNQAYQGGGAIAVIDQGEGTALRILDAGTAKCAAGIVCGRLSNNIAQNASGANQHGAALLYSVDNRSDGVRDIDVRNASFVSNLGATLVRAESHSGVAPHLYLAGAVIYNNWAASDLLQLVTYNPVPAADTGLEITGSTIARNTLGGAVYRGTTDFRMTGSIATQVGHPIVSIISGTLPAGRVVQDLVSDATGIPADPSVMVGDPRFVDLSTGNLHLRSDSPAIDFTSYHALGTDRDGRARTVDLFLVGNRYGATDLGAYELQQDGSGTIGQ
jgi:hypothetical protein